MRILSAVIHLLAVQGTSSLSLCGKADAISNGHFETTQRHLMVDNAGGGAGWGGAMGGGGMNMMVRQLCAIELQYWSWHQESNRHLQETVVSLNSFSQKSRGLSLHLFQLLRQCQNLLQCQFLQPIQPLLLPKLRQNFQPKHPPSPLPNLQP